MTSTRDALVFTAVLGQPALDAASLAIPRALRLGGGPGRAPNPDPAGLLDRRRLRPGHEFSLRPGTNLVESRENGVVFSETCQRIVNSKGVRQPRRPGPVSPAPRGRTRQGRR